MQKIKYATITKRALSFIIDDILVSFLFIVIFYGNIHILTSQEEMINFVIQNSWVLILLKVIYHTFFIAYSGATVGKYVVKIKAIDEDTKEKLSWSKSFTRALVRTLGESFLYLTFLFAFFNNKNQTLHDMVVKCVVIDV